jgi:hypothetical protein
MTIDFAHLSDVVHDHGSPFYALQAERDGDQRENQTIKLRSAGDVFSPLHVTRRPTPRELLKAGDEAATLTSGVFLSHDVLKELTDEDLFFLRDNFSLLPFSNRVNYNQRGDDSSMYHTFKMTAKHVTHTNPKVFLRHARKNGIALSVESRSAPHVDGRLRSSINLERACEKTVFGSLGVSAASFAGVLLAHNHPAIDTVGALVLGAGLLTAVGATLTSVVSSHAVVRHAKQDLYPTLPLTALLDTVASQIKGYQVASPGMA